MKKYILAALAAVAVFAISAFAASLSVNAGYLQAGEGAIDECEGAVTVDYPDKDSEAFTFVGGNWTLDRIDLEVADEDCEGLAFSVVVTDDLGDPIATQSGQFDGGAATVTFEPAFIVEDAADVNVVVRSTTAP